MVFRPPSTIDPKRDKDCKAALLQQDRAMETFRGTERYVEAWKEVCGDMVLTDSEKYTAALRMFLDGMEGGVARAMASTLEPFKNDQLPDPHPFSRLTGKPVEEILHV